MLLNNNNFLSFTIRFNELAYYNNSDPDMIEYPGYFILHREASKHLFKKFKKINLTKTLKK